MRSNAARQISQSLSARLNELKERVRQAEDRAEAFKASHNILGVNGQLVDEQQLSEVNNQLSPARARTAAAKARLDQIQQIQSSKSEIGAFPEAIQSQTITALRSQYAEVMRREAEQMTSLGERHPAVIEIQAQAERLRHMIDDEVRRVALSARSDYESARANDAALAANLDKLKGTAITTNESMVTLRELERDVLASRAVYEAFLVRARETGEQERLDTKNIRIISRAEMPLRRSFPPSNLLLAMAGILFGVPSGSGMVVMREPVRASNIRAAAQLGRGIGHAAARRCTGALACSATTHASRSSIKAFVLLDTGARGIAECRRVVRPRAPPKNPNRASPSSFARCIRLCVPSHQKRANIRAFSSSPPTIRTIPCRSR